MSRGAFDRSAKILFVCARLLLPTAAHADPLDPAQVEAAKALYDEASKLFDAHEYDLACPKLEDVTRNVPEARGAQLLLAKCYEGQGKLASAWRQYMELIKLAEKAADERRLQEAQKNAAALEPRLATVVIEVPDVVAVIPDLSIMLDAYQIPREKWGKPVPVDKGIHVVGVITSGGKVWTELFEVEVEQEKLHLVAKQPAEAANMVSKPREKKSPLRSTNLKPTVQKPREKMKGPASTPPGEAVSSPKEPGWQRSLGFYMLSAGAGAVAVGAVLGGLAFERNNLSNAGHCIKNTTQCRDQQGVELRDEALTLAHGSTAAFIVGGALLMGGTAVLLIVPSRSGGREKSKEAVHGNGTWLRVGLGHMLVGGTW